MLLLQLQQGNVEAVIEWDFFLICLTWEAQAVVICTTNTYRGTSLQRDSEEQLDS